MAMRVVILGNLGDVVKKICELELLEENLHSRDSLISMAAYHKVLEQWPVQDKIKTETLCRVLKVKYAKHLLIEKDLIETYESKRKIHVTDDAFQMAQIASRMIQATGMYLDSLSKIRKMIVQLNDQGSQIDIAPFSFDIQEGSDEPSNNVGAEVK